MTLIGALGGSLRFQENFYEEVFDLVDEGSDVKASKTESSDEMEVTGNDESALTQAEISPDSEPAPTPVQEVQEEMPEEVEALIKTKSMRQYESHLKIGHYFWLMDSEDCDEVQFHSEIICWTKLYSIIDCTTEMHIVDPLLKHYMFLHTRDNGCNLIKIQETGTELLASTHNGELYDNGTMIFDELYADFIPFKNVKRK